MTIYNAQHLSNNKTYEIQRSNHFEVIVSDLGEEFTLTVQRCSLPEMTIGIVELTHGNSKSKVAGQLEFADGSMDIKDAILPDIEDRCYKWFCKAVNPETGKMGWASDYKRDILVNQFAPDGTYIRTWKLQGAWITTFTPGEMDMTNPEAKLISLTIAYDKAIRL